MEVVMFVGIPGCGKSTYFKENYALSHVRINQDSLKKASKMVYLYGVCLKRGISCVLDNCNITAEYREIFIGHAKEAGFEVRCVFFDIPFEICYERNLKRLDPVPDVGIKSKARDLEIPLITEGFKSVEYIRE